MKKAMKFATAAALTVAATGLATAAVQAWGDNSGGRRTYTIAEINKGALGDKIVFNSIKDDGKNVESVQNGSAIMPLTDERYFVGARVDDGDHGKNNVWSSNEIVAEEGKTYIVRIYAHNNNPNGTKAVAENVSVNFSLGQSPDTEQRIDGYINVPNQTISKYWDQVVFKSKTGKRFYLDYVEGSALLENNGIGKNGGVRLSDEVISKGVKIGYNALDGKVPGCYTYANYITIKVTPVYEDSSITKQVRKLGDKEWKTSVDANVGDKVEYQIHYKNMNASNVSNVVIRDSLPDNMKYIAGTTKLYNAAFPNGATNNENTLTVNGVNIGNYAPKGDAYVRFTAEVIDKNLGCGNNRLINWAKASANGYAVQASADVYVAKKCEEEKVEYTVKFIDCDKNETVKTVSAVKGKSVDVTSPWGQTYTVNSDKTINQTNCSTDKYEYKVTFIDCDKKQTVTTAQVKAAGDPVEVTSPWGQKYTVKGSKTIEQTNCTEKQPEKQPEKLPNTGVSGVVSGVLGLGSIVTAAGYYIASRKQLR